MELSALKRAIEKAGGQSALARACGVKQGHVWHWLNKSLRVPAEHAISVETATGGAVKRHELRPDIFEHGGDSPKAARSNVNIAEQIALLEAKQHRAVREALLKRSGASERLAKIDRAISALRALGETGK